MVETATAGSVRFSKATKLEFLHIRDCNRTSPDAEAVEHAQAFDLRVNLFS